MRCSSFTAAQRPSMTPTWLCEEVQRDAPSTPQENLQTIRTQSQVQSTDKSYRRDVPQSSRLSRRLRRAWPRPRGLFPTRLQEELGIFKGKRVSKDDLSAMRKRLREKNHEIRKQFRHQRAKPAFPRISESYQGDQRVVKAVTAKVTMTMTMMVNTGTTLNHYSTFSPLRPMPLTTTTMLQSRTWRTKTIAAPSTNSNQDSPVTFTPPSHSMPQHQTSLLLPLRTSTRN